MPDRHDTGSTRIPERSFTLSKRPAAFPSGVWSEAVRGQGPYLYTRSGQKYLDWMCALGALTVGHAHIAVVSAVCRQMRQGAIFSLPSDLEERLAKRLCQVIPCAEQVRVVKTGSEACSAAVRIARLKTGRDVFVTDSTSYHGWHDGMIAAKARHPGVPAAVAEAVRVFQHDDLESLKHVLYRAPGNMPAAVMLEPIQGTEPAGGHTAYLTRVKEIAHEAGALVIFDEMLSGGRLRLGGAQAMTGVVPDLATFGKALGGGLPLAFVCGRRDLMAHAWPVSGTFSGDTLALAACDAMLNLYRDENVIVRLWEAGRSLMSALEETAAALSLPFRLQGQPPRFWWDYGPGIDRRLAQSVFVQQCARQGVLVHPAVVFASAAMDGAALSESVGAMCNALKVVAFAVKNGTLADAVVGHPYEDSVR